MLSPSQVDHETVEIGGGQGVILEVGTNGIRYRDEEGIDQEISLTRYVGQCGC